MRRLDRPAVAALAREAAAAARGRAHQLWHADHGDPVQRLAMALQPGTYVRPHRHAEPPKWEAMVLLAGRVDVLLFDDDGRVTDRATLAGEGGSQVVEIPAAAWHSLVAVEPDSALFEFKQGPFAPSSFAGWAPDEGHSHAAAFERWLRGAQPGDCWGGAA